MCWGAGILLSSGVVRAVANLEGDIAWRIPFACQWAWPIPLMIGAYLAPESPWNAVRRNKPEVARKSLSRLVQESPDKEHEVEATLAYIVYTTDLEKAETADANFIDCFRGTNLRRTEIVCLADIPNGLTLKADIILELRRLGCSNPLRKCYSWLFRRLSRICRLHSNSSLRSQHWSLCMLYCRRYNLLVHVPPFRPCHYIYGWIEYHVLHLDRYRSSWFCGWVFSSTCHWYSARSINIDKYGDDWSGLLSHSGRNAIWKTAI